MAVHVPEERLLTVVRHLHRTAGAQRQHARVHLHAQVLPAAERPADTGQRQPHLVEGQAECACRLLLVDVQPLRGEVKVHAALVVGHREAGLRTQESLVLHADLVHPRHHDLGGHRRVALHDPLMAHHIAAGME
jgi:hypothetical protein